MKNNEEFQAWVYSNFEVKHPLYIYEGVDIPGWRPEDIPDQDAPSLTPYTVPGYLPRPAMVVLPGGGFHFKAPLEAEPVAQFFKVHGIHAFVLNYRIHPYHLPYPRMDVLRAIRYLRYHAEELNIDPNMIGVVGFSAGGYYTGAAATRFDLGNPDSSDLVERMSSRPDAAIMCYPAVSMGGRLGLRRKSLANLVDDYHNDAAVEDATLETHVPDNAPPVMIFHTASDELVDLRHALIMAEALHEKNIPVEMHVFPEGRHGLDLAFDDPHVNQWTELAIHFLRHVGFQNPRT